MLKIALHFVGFDVNICKKVFELKNQTSWLIMRSHRKEFHSADADDEVDDDSADDTHCDECLNDRVLNILAVPDKSHD